MHDPASTPRMPNDAVVRPAVQALLGRSPAFARLDPATARSLEDTLSTLGGMLAGHDDAVDFPGFVAGLVEGTFQAIVDASIQQMQDYAAALAEVARSLQGSVAGAGGGIAPEPCRLHLLQRCTALFAPHPARPAQPVLRPLSG